MIKYQNIKIPITAYQNTKSVYKINYNKIKASYIN